MQYDFDKPVDRHGTNSYKYDTMPSEDVIPLWVADMDFETAPVVQEALRKRIEHGCFGYTAVPESFYEATIQWFSRRHGWTPKRESFVYTSGVVPAISAIIKSLTLPGDKVLVQTPVYNCFFSSIRNNGCQVEYSPLHYKMQKEEYDMDKAEALENQPWDSHLSSYSIDFYDFEQKCADPRVRIFILCNPHNPAGKAWTATELRRIGDICKRHNVFVIADEIHCEFVSPGYQYTPFASVSDAPCAVCISPTKAFNIAGLQIANIICDDATIRERIDRAINMNEVCDVNPFGVIALQAAYTPEGEEWLEQLNAYIYENYQLAVSMLSRSDHFRLTRLEATYLLWVQFATPPMITPISEVLLQMAKVCVSDGVSYDPSCDDFIRINLATQRKTLKEGLSRILHFVENDFSDEVVERPY